MSPIDRRPLRLFIACSSKDRELKDQLIAHLQVLVAIGAIDLWDADIVPPGAETLENEDRAFEEADVAIILVSSDFLAADRVQTVNIEKLFDRGKRRTLQIIPVIVRACLWDAHPLLRELKPLPHSQKAIASYQGNDRDQVLSEVAAEIARRVGNVLGDRGLAPTNGTKAQTFRGNQLSRTVAAAPTPNFPDEQTRVLSGKLAAAQERRARLSRQNANTTDVNKEILDIKRQLREGGQLKPGDCLGDSRYLLLDIVGRGGFATVWRAHDSIRNEVVAIKVLHSNLAGDRIRLDRFKRGARIMSSLQHDAIVRILEPYGEDGGWHYFVMEFMHGGDLHRAVTEQKMNSENAILAVLHIANALAEAHEKSIVHRDVKPANILLDQNLVPKLADFDLVDVADTTGGTRTGALGTPMYAAPELLSHPMDADARSDVFGLGMTAVFCIFGQALPGNSIGRVERIIDMLECSVDVKVVLKRATNWDEPDARYPNAAAFQLALAEALTTPSGRLPTDEQEIEVEHPAAKSSTLDKVLSVINAGFQNFPEATRFAAGLTSRKPVGTTARILAIPAMVLHSATVYLGQAKTSEAKNVLRCITRSLSEYMERTDEHGNRPQQLPPSAPLTPHDIPRGKKALPDENTWSHPTWVALRFEINDPVYFSYEIVTAQDGRSAVIRAHGDPDGKDKIIILERTVSIDSEGNLVAPPEIITREAAR